MDSETIARDRYVEALRRLDPGRPADDGEIVARPGWDRFREVSLQARAGTRFRYALHGSVGVGKTTELLAWRTRLSAMGVKAAYVAFHPRAHQLHQLLKGKASEGAQVLLVDGLDLQQNEAETWFGPGTVLVDAELPALVAVAPAVVGRGRRTSATRSSPSSTCRRSRCSDGTSTQRGPR